MDLTRRVAIVTGAAVGTGRAIAERLAVEGTVVAFAADEAAAGQVVVLRGGAPPRLLPPEEHDAA